MQINTLTFELKEEYNGYSDYYYMASKAKIDGQFLLDMVREYDFENDQLGEFGPWERTYPRRLYVEDIYILQDLYRMLHPEEEDEDEEFPHNRLLAMTCPCTFEWCDDFRLEYQRNGDFIILDGSCNYRASVYPKFPTYTVSKQQLQQEFNRLFAEWQKLNPNKEFDKYRY